MVNVWNAENRDRRWWSVVNEQARDMAENDNMTVAMQREAARQMREWAASRAGQAGWSGVVHCGAVAAQEMDADASRRVRGMVRAV